MYSYRLIIDLSFNFVFIDGLTDEVTTSAKGASLVLCSLLETRGYEEDVAGNVTFQIICIFLLICIL